MFLKNIIIIILTHFIHYGNSRLTNYPSVVPYPQQVVTYPTAILIDSNDFEFITKKVGKCDILKDIINRYKKLIFIRDCSQLKAFEYSDYENNYEIEFSAHENYLKNITIEIKHNCDNVWPELNMDEMYTLRVNTNDFPNQALLFANTIWGALRGLETFSQLVDHQKSSIFIINTTIVVDYPRFSHRGLLIDTSRHYIPIHIMLENLDAMSYHKLNVLHWHIVDDQSFPYVSQAFPKLSAKGSYNQKTHIYSDNDIQYVIQYARVRGIRVLIEFDTPGHTQSWGKGYPELLTKCYTGDLPNGLTGPIDPSNAQTFDFLMTLFKEISNKFPEKFIHLGGDEVEYLCWMTNPNITNFMKALNISGNYNKLEEYYFTALIDIINNLNNSYIVWQEVFDRNINLPKDTVINVWKSDYDLEVYEVTKLGYRVIHSSCWYLNNITYGYDWFQYYSCDPLSFNGSAEQNRLVIGGEASMWGEWVDGSNFMSRTWPRIVAVAERLWSSRDLQNTTEAKYRFVENRCRMLDRGLRFQPIVEPTEYDFGFCKCDYNV